MKTLQHTLKLAMIAFVLVFASCSKDDSPAEDNAQLEELTNHELLMSGKWYVQSTTGGGSYNECERQTYLHFIDEDTLIIQSYGEDGAMNCLADPVQNVAYQMIGEDAFIFVDSPTFQFIIEFITETQLVLRQTDGIDSSIISMIK